MNCPTIRLKSNGHPFQGERAAVIAEWMAENGGSVADCARDTGLTFEVVKKGWQRIRRNLGAQAV